MNELLKKLTKILINNVKKVFVKDHEPVNDNNVPYEVLKESAVFSRWAGNAPKLETIGGNADFCEWEGNAPELKTIKGNANFRHWSGNAPNLETIEGAVNFSGWTGSAPKLDKKYIFSDLIGSRVVTCKFEKETKLYKTGCFTGTASELLAACIATHGIDSGYTKQYKEFILKCEPEFV